MFLKQFDTTRLMTEAGEDAGTAAMNAPATADAAELMGAFSKGDRQGAPPKDAPTRIFGDPPAPREDDPSLRDVDPKYKNPDGTVKSHAEIIKMHQNAEKLLGEKSGGDPEVRSQLAQLTTLVQSLMAANAGAGAGGDGAGIAEGVAAGTVPDPQADPAGFQVWLQRQVAQAGEQNKMTTVWDTWKRDAGKTDDDIRKMQAFYNSPAATPEVLDFGMRHQELMAQAIRKGADGVIAALKKIADIAPATGAAHAQGETSEDELADLRDMMFNPARKAEWARVKAMLGQSMPV